jgi:WD40 repeat protein
MHEFQPIGERVEGHVSHVSVRFSRDGSQIWTAVQANLNLTNVDDLRSSFAWRNTHSEIEIGHAALTSLRVGECWTAVGSRDGYARLFALPPTEPAFEYHHASPVHSVALNPTETQLAAGEFDGSLTLWDIERGDRLWSEKVHRDCIYSLDFSPCGNLLASGSGDGDVHLWRMTEAGPEQLSSVRSPSGRTIRRVRFTPDGAQLGVLVQHETAIRMWDLTKLRHELAALGLAW